MSASRSILAPLTTTFTPPSQCSTIGVGGNLASTLQYWEGQTCSGGSPHDASECWPPALLPVPSPTPNLNGWGLYSPGLHCPVGYYSACTQAVKTDGSPSSLQLGTSFDFQFPLTAGETGIGCCPVGLTCTDTQGFQTCGYVQTTGAIQGPIGFCEDSGTDYAPSTQITVGNPYSQGSGNSSTVVTIAEVSLYGPLIQIVFKSTDISSLASPTSPSPTFQSPTSRNSALYGSAPTATVSSTNSDSGGLSTGAKAGIGVGVAVGVLALLALLGLFILRRRRAHRNNMGGPLVAPNGLNANEEKHKTYEQPAGHPVQPLQQQHEMPVPNQNAELDAENSRPTAELAAENLRSPISASTSPYLGTPQDPSRLHSRQSPDTSRLNSPRF